MKIIKKNKELKKVSDDEAIKMISLGWKYAPKSEWKLATRPVKTDEKLKEK